VVSTPADPPADRREPRTGLAGSHVLMKRRAFLLGSLGIAALACDRNGGAPSASEDAIGPLLATSALASRLEDVKSGKLAVFYIGPEALFARGHIPGAKNLGEISSPGGREALRKALDALPEGTEAVVYCGCCPVRSCPNVRPASAEVRASKRKAYVLDLPTRFATDWADKGLAVEKG